LAFSTPPELLQAMFRIMSTSGGATWHKFFLRCFAGEAEDIETAAFQMEIMMDIDS